MPNAAQRSVVILYEHALLGEGIAKHLRAKARVEATVVSTRHPEAVTSALALGPAVVIFESSDPFNQFDLSQLAPQAVLIDVSTVIMRGAAVAPCPAGLEQILAAVRDTSIVAGPTEPDPLGTMPGQTEPSPLDVVAGPTEPAPLGALAAPMLHPAAPTL